MVLVYQLLESRRSIVTLLCFLACRMAANAIRQLWETNVLFPVFFLNLRSFVFVAAVAGIFDVIRGMAGDATHFTLFTMVQWEAVSRQLSRLPGIGAVASSAIRPE